MAFNVIDSTTPKGTDKMKDIDNDIRIFKEQTINNLKEISGYPDNSAPSLPTWTTATRPSINVTVGLCGYNSDLQCIERYNGTDWISLTSPGVLKWTTTTRPSTNLYDGLMGYCSDLDVFERYNSTTTTFERVNSAKRGDIKMWSGAVADIATKQVGWVLANGQSVTIDGSTFVVTNLVDKFVIGAGSTYTVGATGGEASHTLTVNEMPSHAHNYTNPLIGSGGTANGNLHDGEETMMPYSNAGVTVYTGGGLAHNNMPPYYALCFLYKL